MARGGPEAGGEPGSKGRGVAAASPAAIDPAIGAAGSDAGGRLPDGDLPDIRALAFAATTASIVVTDPRLPDNPIVDANPAFERLTGYDRSEIVGRNCRFLQGPQTDRAAIARLREAVAAGHVVEETILNHRKDGRPFWNEVRITPVRDRAGRLTHLVGVQTDVTARIEAELALAGERDLLQAVLDQIPDAVYVKDAAFRFVRLNRATAATIGVAEVAEAIGKTDDDFFPPALAREYRTDEHRVLETGEPLLDKLEWQGAGEAARRVLASKAPLRDAAGRIVGIVGINRDVTDRVRAEDALRASEARFRAAADGSMDAFFLLEAVRDRAGTILDFRFVHLNRRGGELIGRDPAAVVGHLLCELLPINRTGGFMEKYARVVETGVALEEEYPIAVPDIAASWIHHQVVKVGDGIAITSRDVSERKRAEADLRAAKEAAEEANRLKSQFLSTMSHELRTPLTAIVGFADLLRGILDSTGMEQEAEDARQILRSSRHLMKLIDDVLSFSRLGSGQVVLQPEPIDVAALAADVAAELEPLAAAKGIRMVVAADQPPTIDADPVRLRQVLLNLVGNAVKFTDGGAVTIAVRRTDSAVDIVVTDTGIGIAPAALPNVFEEFRQADGSTTRRYGGTGLGLAIARRLVEMHDGTIRAESQPGVGSTFTVRLPVPFSG